MSPDQNARLKWRVLGVVGLGAFLSTLNITIVNVALPSIAEDLRVGIDDVQLVVLGYLLALGTLLLAFGRLGDIVGYRRVYVWGLAVFGVASLLCGLSENVWALSGFRVLQGVGSGMVQAIGPALLVRVFPAEERGKAQGLFAISIALGITVGPTLGAFLTEWLSWSWVFLVNAPLCLLGIVWSLRVLPVERRAEGRTFDPLGAFLLFGATSTLLLAVLGGGRWGWTSPMELVLVVAFLLLGAAFVATERRVSQPMLDLGLLRIRAVWAGNVSVLVAFATLFTATFLIPFYLQDVRGFSVIETGLFLTPLPLATLLVAPFGGTLSDRVGSRILTASGTAFIGGGLLLLTGIDASSGAFGLVWRLAVAGVGLGLFIGANQSLVLGAVPSDRLGMTSGMLAQVRNMGQAFGVALAGAVVAARLSFHTRELAGTLPDGLVQRDAFVLAIHDAFYVGAIICILGILVSLISERRKTTPVNAEAAPPVPARKPKDIERTQAP
ncbi:MFS transporter [Rubrobacter indicoceani]|uniref:MFS transporter n=1 Tax=Rubrobacter indicoceani TaxID=2051957 RepID=UPI000E5BF752|nr:MFS transporter [Rubrobacter indicoceani]